MNSFLTSFFNQLRLEVLREGNAILFSTLFHYLCGSFPIQICISIKINLNKRCNYLQPVLSRVYCNSKVKNILSAINMKQVGRRKLTSVLGATGTIYPIFTKDS